MFSLRSIWKIILQKKVVLIEIGREIGGRSITRLSKKYKGWKLNHGSPNFNISNIKNNLLLKRYVDELLENKYIKIDDSDILFLNEDSNLETVKKSQFSCGDNYLSLDSMSELSKKIIESNNLKERIDFFFETFIVDMKFNDKEWLLTSKNGDKFKSKYLICSTNLLLHKRSLKILNENQIPLRKAIPINNDKKIDLLLNIL